MPNDKTREVFIECVQVGHSLRVTATDATTGLEVTFQAPAKATPADLKFTAINKLKYVMRKQQEI